MADALHAHGFNFLQATNYLWPNVTPGQLIFVYHLPFTICAGLHSDKLYVEWLAEVYATRCSGWHCSSCCTKCCLIILKFGRTWRPQTLHWLQHNAKEVWQSVAWPKGRPSPRMWQQPGNIGTFIIFGPGARTQDHIQHPPSSRRQQLLQHRRGNFLSHVTLPGCFQ